MLISRRVESPLWPLKPNKVDRTWGLYGHLPKFINCKKETWEYRPHRDFDDDKFIEQMQDFYADCKKFHAKCWWPFHITYKGYLRFMFPRKGMITWWYHGNPYRPKNIEWIPDAKRKFEGKGVF